MILKYLDWIHPEALNILNRYNKNLDLKIYLILNLKIINQHRSLEKGQIEILIQRQRKFHLFKIHQNFITNLLKVKVSRIKKIQSNNSFQKVVPRTILKANQVLKANLILNFQ